MSKNIFCFSGWAQHYQGLEFLFQQKSCSVSSFNYSAFVSYQHFLENTSFTNPQIVVGWSLGGQIALRLIASKILQPKFLVMLAPPFQMVKNNKISAGMPPETAKTFYENFAKSPLQTLQQFSVLSSLNDSNSKEMLKNLHISNENQQNWLMWLKEL